MDAVVDYSRSVDERMNWSCINSTFDILSFDIFTFDVFSVYQIYAIQKNGVVSYHKWR